VVRGRIGLGGGSGGEGGVEKANAEGRGREYRKERNKKVLCKVGGSWNRVV